MRAPGDSRFAHRLPHRVGKRINHRQVAQFAKAPG
jgi:hypothetical protein